MKDGDFLEIEYVGRISGTNEIFDLTSEEIAKKEGIFDPKQKYGPALVIVGAGMAIPGVEKQLNSMKVGEEKEFSVKPEDGFGKRNIKLIKIISLANFTRENINPVPGIFVTINGRQAKIQSVSGGRVRVDFNHPLAGKELLYHLKIIRKLDTVPDKIKALLKYYGLDCEPLFKEGKLIIRSEKPIQNKIQDILKKTITKWIPDVKDTEFISKETKTGPDKASQSENKKTRKPEKTNV